MQKIKFYGIGGQGAVTAAKVYSRAVSLYENKYAITVPAYGHERRGAPVFAHIIEDDEPVKLNCFVYEPDIVAVFDDTLIDKHVNIQEGCSESTVLILNTSSRDMVKRYREECGFQKIFWANADQAAIHHIGKPIPNCAMLGILAKAGAVSLEAAETAIKDVFGKVGEKNAQSAREAYNCTEEE